MLKHLLTALRPKMQKEIEAHAPTVNSVAATSDADVAKAFQEREKLAAYAASLEKQLAAAREEVSLAHQRFIQASYDTRLSIYDVVAYILQQKGPMEIMKIQRLLYFMQVAYMIVNHGEELFHEQFVAWGLGPMCLRIWKEHTYQYKMDKCPGNPDKMNSKQLRAVDSILKAYGDVDAVHVAQISRTEPWKRAWAQSRANSHSNTPIDMQFACEFYAKEWEWDEKEATTTSV